MAERAPFLVLTFLLGAALARVSLCALAATQQLVERRQWAGLHKLLLAAAGAGCVLLVLHLWEPSQVLLPGAMRIDRALILGGVLLGAGALINGGCYLGSVLYLGSGNLNFLFTLCGIGIGLRTAQLAWPAWASMAVLSRGVMAQWQAWTGLLICALLVLLALTRRDARRAALWPLLAGGLAGLVYAHHPGWSYGRVIDGLAHGAWRRMDWLAGLSALCLFAGAIISSWLSGRWKMQRPNPLRGARCLGGGVLLGLGAAFVPGGNDSLLLWSIPGLALYGVLAYGTMLLTLTALLTPATLWRQLRSVAR